MSNQTLFLIMGISGGLFVFTIIAYLIMRQILNKSDIKHIKQLKEGTKEKKIHLRCFIPKNIYLSYKSTIFK